MRPCSTSFSSHSNLSTQQSCSAPNGSFTNSWNHEHCPARKVFQFDKCHRTFKTIRSCLDTSYSSALYSKNVWKFQGSWSLSIAMIYHTYQCTTYVGVLPDTLLCKAHCCCNLNPSIQTHQPQSRPLHQLASLKISRISETVSKKRIKQPFADILANQILSLICVVLWAVFDLCPTLISFLILSMLWLQKFLFSSIMFVHLQPLHYVKMSFNAACPFHGCPKPFLTSGSAQQLLLSPLAIII